jgi:arabinogalactan endo-1,4-beta-galactosidase
LHDIVFEYLMLIDSKNSTSNVHGCRSRLSQVVACVVAAVATCCELARAAEFMAGADISALTVHEGRGATYRDAGVQGSAIEILRDHGANWFRLRLFVNPNPASDPFVANNLSYTIALAQRVKASGGKLLLDFHYSDTWADPGRQNKPAAWSALGLGDLVTRVHDYTRDSIAAFREAGVLPEMVQVGNEIANGMLWQSGYVWTGGSHDAGFDNLAALLNAGISGAKEGAGESPQPLVMIHHDKGAQWNTTSFFFNKLAARNVDFDVIGYSYYPKWHYNPASGAGDIDDLETNLHNTANAYGKPIVIVETGFASRGAQFEPDYEFDVSAAGQQQFLETIIDVVQGVPNGLGQGVFWWYPEARPTSGLNVWEGGRYGLFDQNGNLLPAASAFEQFIDETLAGDYNDDGHIDAADYVVWRKSAGTMTDLPNDPIGELIGEAQYNQWRTNFGRAAEVGAASRAASIQRQFLRSIPAVPEPPTLVTLLVGLVALVQRLRYITQRQNTPWSDAASNCFRTEELS